MPSVATMTPPIAPPTSRATLNWMLFRAIAFPTRSRPTISGTSACWAGFPKALVIPSANARTPTSQYWTVPDQTSKPRMTAWTRAAVWVAMRRRRRGRRSAMTPPISGKTSIGRNWSMVIVPSATAECVSCRTSHDCAIDWAQVPMPETSWLAQ